MSMFATIYNTDDDPLTNGVEITDDAEFDELETQASEFASDGIRCCIRWSRDSDGQTAYWGPSGATIKPHWYSRPPAKRGQGRKSMQGAGKSPVLQVVVSPELKASVMAYGMPWAREVLAKAVAKKQKADHGTV